MKRSIEDKVLIGTMIILMFCAGISFFSMAYYKTQLRECQTTSTQYDEETIDSLKAELFIQSTLNGRYEIAIKQLAEKHPSIVYELDSLMSDIE